MLLFFRQSETFNIPIPDVDVYSDSWKGEFLFMSKQQSELQISCHAKEISKLLTKYCIKVCNINGLDTYIISPKYYGDMLADTKLLDKLSISIFASIDSIKTVYQYSKNG